MEQNHYHPPSSSPSLQQRSQQQQQISSEHDDNGDYHHEIVDDDVEVHVPNHDILDATCQNNNALTPRYLLGLLFVLLQCIVWIGGAVLTQYLYETIQFHSSFIMSYIGMSLLSVCLPIYFITSYNCHTPNDTNDGIIRTSSSLSVCTFDMQIKNAQNCSDYTFIATTGTRHYLNKQDDDQSADDTNITSNRYYDMIEDQDISKTKNYRPPNAHGSTPMQHRKRYWGHRKHMIAAAILGPSMFLADYLFNQALYYTSVASATVLVSTQCIFVFLLSTCYFHLETYSFCKLAGVLLSFIGTVCTAMKDQDKQEQSNDPYNTNNQEEMAIMSHPLVGDMIAIMAAVLYAIYTTQVRVYCPQDENLYSMLLLLGYIGLLCWICFLPLAIYIFITNYHEMITHLYENDVSNADDDDNGDHKHYRMTLLLIVVLLSKGMMDFLITDYCLFRSIILTNPTVATVGLGLTIPMAFVSDAIWQSHHNHHTTATTTTTGTASTMAERWYSSIGAIAVLVGFLMVNLAPEKKDAPGNHITVLSTHP